MFAPLGQWSILEQAGKNLGFGCICMDRQKDIYFHLATRLLMVDSEDEQLYNTCLITDCMGRKLFVAQKFPSAVTNLDE